MPKCSVANAPIDSPTTCARWMPQRIEHAADVVARARLRVALDILGHVGGRIAARVVGDAAVAAREVAQLRLPAAVVAGELVHEHDRRAAAGLLVVELDAVVGGKLRHVARAIELNLKGKRVLVTGASKGIGRACAEPRNRPTYRALVLTSLFPHGEFGSNASLLLRVPCARPYAPRRQASAT